MAEPIRQAIRKNWHIVQMDTDLRDKTSKPPIISFTRSKRLRDELVRGRFLETNKNKNWLRDVAPPGNYSCRNCNHCKYMLCQKDLQIGAVQFSVRDFITCRTNYVVYILFCKFYYIGKTIRPLHIRIREHMYSIRTGKGCPRLIAHIREVHGGDPETLRFAGLKRIMISCDGGDRHKNLLRCEAKLILRMQALGPIGLNDRNDLSPFL